MWVNKFLGLVMFSLFLSQTSTLDQAENIGGFWSFDRST